MTCLTAAPGQLNYGICMAQEVNTSLWVPTGHPLTSNCTLEAEEDLAKGHC